MRTRVHNLQRKENRLMFGMLAPSVLAVFAISIVPLAYTFYLSFCNYSLVSSESASFTGLQNYLKLFQDETIRGSILVTFQYTILSVIFSTLVGVGLAIVVNQIKIGKSFFRVVFFVPMMLSGVVVGVLVQHRPGRNQLFIRGYWPFTRQLDRQRANRHGQHLDCRRMAMVFLYLYQHPCCVGSPEPGTAGSRQCRWSKQCPEIFLHQIALHHAGYCRLHCISDNLGI